MTDRKVAFSEYLSRPETARLWLAVGTVALYLFGLAGWFVLVATLSVADAHLLAWFIAALYFFTAMGVYARWAVVAAYNFRKE